MDEHGNSWDGHGNLRDREVASEFVKMKGEMASADRCKSVYGLQEAQLQRERPVLVWLINTNLAGILNLLNHDDYELPTSLQKQSYFDLAVET